MVDQTLFACMAIALASVAVSFHAAEKSDPDRRGSAHRKGSRNNLHDCNVNERTKAMHLYLYCMIKPE